MNKKVVMPIAMIVIAVTVLTLAGCNKNNSEENEMGNTASGSAISENVSNQKTNVVAKEFTMTSFVVMSGTTPQPQYSLTGITVKKGDLVRIKVTVTKGMHDFNIDGFDVHSETPLNQETVIEFTADKAGTFIYYCSKPGHRANGHWGTLTVTE